MIAALVIAGVVVGFMVLIFWALAERNERQLLQRQIPDPRVVTEQQFLERQSAADRQQFGQMATTFVENFRRIEQLEELEQRRTHELEEELALYTDLGPVNIGHIAQAVRQLTDTQRALDRFRDQLHRITARIERAVQEVPHDAEQSLIERYHDGTLQDYLDKVTIPCL